MYFLVDNIRNIAKLNQLYIFSPLVKNVEKKRQYLYRFWIKLVNCSGNGQL